MSNGDDVVDYLTKEELDQLVQNNSSFSNFESMVQFIESVRSVIVGDTGNFITTFNLESHINDLIALYTEYSTLEQYLKNNVGIKRNYIRGILATAILTQTNELLDQATLKGIMLREIFLNIIANEVGDSVTFDTIKDESQEIDFGKYFVESM